MYLCHNLGTKYRNKCSVWHRIPRRFLAKFRNIILGKCSAKQFYRCRTPCFGVFVFGFYETGNPMMQAKEKKAFTMAASAVCAAKFG